MLTSHRKDHQPNPVGTYTPRVAYMFHERNQDKDGNRYSSGQSNRLDNDRFLVFGIHRSLGCNPMHKLLWTISRLVMGHNSFLFIFSEEKDAWNFGFFTCLTEESCPTRLATTLQRTLAGSMNTSRKY